MKKEDFKKVLFPIHRNFWQIAYKKLMSKISTLKSTLKRRSKENNIKFDIEILDQTKLTPAKTQTANASSFIQVTNTDTGDDSNVFVTSAFEGNQKRNFDSILHSIAIHPNAYTGKIDIQASCIENTPSTANNSSDWFSISNVTLSANSTIYHETFQVNANYIRVMSEPSAGNITLVQLRN